MKIKFKMKKIPKFLIYGTTKRRYELLKEKGINPDYNKGIQFWGDNHPEQRIFQGIDFAIKRARNYKRILDEEPV